MAIIDTLQNHCGSDPLVELWKDLNPSAYQKMQAQLALLIADGVKPDIIFKVLGVKITKLPDLETLQH